MLVESIHEIEAEWKAVDRQVVVRCNQSVLQLALYCVHLLVIPGSNFNDSILFTEHITVFGRPNPHNRRCDAAMSLVFTCIVPTPDLLRGLLTYSVDCATL